ncbi:Glu/Leu/Phe/Val dehydrogenase family protein [Nocardioides sp. TF02-7]|nr:Glu/Leu/Phe/Val dehydrogenase family protein [Nocardioides sp. TF02-7]UMG94812.1 Glu/Leu/Phe/Val dehydrogenase family protein [Nocardioides sp. TF02-7]
MGHLVEAGADVVVTDVNPAAVARVADEHPSVGVVGSTADLVAAELDVYAPCALGGALDDAVVRTLGARVVCGAANNQLAHPGVEKLVEERGIVYAPDYVVNAGGLIQVADEFEGFSFERARQRAAGIYDTTRAVLERARSEGVPTATAADRIAEQRIREGRAPARHLARLTPSARHEVESGLVAGRVGPRGGSSRASWRVESGLMATRTRHDTRLTAPRGRIRRATTPDSTPRRAGECQSRGGSA